MATAADLFKSPGLSPQVRGSPAQDGLRKNSTLYPDAQLESARVAMARLFYRLRRRRDALFGEGLFSEPAWDMLLDLYVAEHEGRSLCVSSACIGAAVPQTTGLRWMGKLETLGLVHKTVDPADLRRLVVRLTPAGLEKMEDLLRGLLAATAAGR